MSHFLARASVPGPQPGDTLLFTAPFPPQGMNEYKNKKESSFVDLHKMIQRLIRYFANK